MSTLIDSMRALKVWQIVTLAAVPFVAAGITLAAYSIATGSGDDGLETDQQLIPVQRGDLINQVSVNGSLVYSVRETLTFGSQGTVGEVLVEEGQTVAAGESLATLDAASIASLEKAVAQAEVKLRDAQDALASSRDPHTPLDLAQAELKVATAALSLKDAEEALADLRKPSTSAIAKAEATVALAQLSLQQAEESLEALLKPTAQAIATAESRVTDARVAVDEAAALLGSLRAGPTPEDLAVAESRVTDARVAIDEAAATLDALRASPTPEDLADAQAQVDSAEATLTTAEADLKLAKLEWDSKVEGAQDVLDAAVAGYRSVMTKWLGMNLVDAELDVDSDELLASKGIDLETLFDRSRRFEDPSRGYLSAGPPSDDHETPWNETTVYIWLNLWPGVILPTCDDGAVPAQGACVSKEIEDQSTSYGAARDALETTLTLREKAFTLADEAVTRANDAVATAREQMADVAAGPDPIDIETQESRLALAEAKLQSAEDDLLALTDGPVPLDIEAQERRLALAEANLETAEDDLLALAGEPDPVEVDAKRKEIAVARADLDDAQQALTTLLEGPDSAELVAKERQVAVAGAGLDEAGEELTELISSADPLEVALREAEVAAAQSELETALDRLAGTTLRAPLTGFVSTIGAEAGQQVNVNTPILEIVDPTVVEVDGVVDEIDVLFIQAGASASITMDALPGQTLTGTVSEIASAATSQQGVVTYPLSIRVEVPEGTQLPEGLSAVASVVIREDRDVLLVPVDALSGTFQQPTLRVMSGGEIVERPVVVGNSDDFWIVIAEGVAETETVVMQVQGATTQGFGGGFRQFTGGFGGGRGGFGGGGRGAAGQGGRR